MRVLLFWWNLSDSSGEKDHLFWVSLFYLFFKSIMKIVFSYEEFWIYRVITRTLAYINFTSCLMHSNFLFLITEQAYSSLNRNAKMSPRSFEPHDSFLKNFHCSINLTYVGHLLPALATHLRDSLRRLPHLLEAGN